MRTLVIAALPEEAAGLKRALRRDSSRAASVQVAVVGDGASRATRALDRILDRGRFDRVVLIGFCGALTPEQEIGDLHRVGQVFGPDPEVDPLLLSEDGVLLASAPRLVATPEEKEALRRSREPGPLIVDLESFAIAQRLQDQGISLEILRIVSDRHDERLHSAIIRASRGDGSVSRLRLILGLLLRPWEIPGILPLGRRARHLSELLAGGVFRGLEPAGSLGIESGGKLD